MESAEPQGPSLDHLADQLANLTDVVSDLTEKLASLSDHYLALLDRGDGWDRTLDGLARRLTDEIAAAHSDIKRLENWVEAIRPGSKLRHCRRCGRQLADYEKGEWHTSCKPGGPEV